MIERLAVDANAVIDLIRGRADVKPLFRGSQMVLLPLPVLAELLTGAYSSVRSGENLAVLEDVVGEWIVLVPNVETAHQYGRLRAQLRDMPRGTQNRINDLWIAALCLQHNVPLLSNDRGFETIPDLTVIQW
jgi:tRNA(fMet)-specific endonuclease VapC